MTFPVLLVDLSYRFGGASTRTLALLHALQDSCALACLQGSAVAAGAAERRLPHHVVGSHKLDPRIAVNLTGLVRRHGYRVLDCQNAQSKFWAALAVQFAPSALVCTLNSWAAAEYEGNVRGVFYRSVEDLVARRTNFYVAVSHDIHRRLLEHGVSEQEVGLVPNAVDVDGDTIPVDRTQLRAELGIPADARLCCAVGRMVEAKGYPHLIDALSELPMDSVHCLLVGDGKLMEDLRRRAEQRGMAGRVHFLGYRGRDEVLRLVKGSDLFLMPSLTEGTPVALLEAMALGTPIVASRVGGIPEMVRHGEHAWLVEAGDVTGLTRAIAMLLQTPDLAERLARNARARLQTEFGFDAQRKAMQRVYHEAVRRHRNKRGEPVGGSSGG